MQQEEGQEQEVLDAEQGENELGNTKRCVPTQEIELGTIFSETLIS